MRRLFFPIAGWSVLVTGALFLGAIYGQLFILNSPVVVYNGLPFAVDRPVYRAGQVVSVLFDQCRATDAPSTVTLSLISDERVYPQEVIYGNGTAMCSKRYVAVAYIRSTVQPGVYRIVGRTSINPSPLTQRIASWSTQEFTIEAWPDKTAKEGQ